MYSLNYLESANHRRAAVSSVTLTVLASVPRRAFELAKYWRTSEVLFMESKVRTLPEVSSPTPTG